MYEITKKDLLYADKIIAKVFKIPPTNAIYDDIISVAYEGVFKAVKAYDCNKGGSINTLIYTYVIWEINQFLRKNYAKEFTNKTMHVEEEYSVDMLTYLANREDTAKAVLEIDRCFTKGESTIFSDWVLGEPTNLIIHKYSIPNATLRRLINNILKKAKECSQT